MEVKAKSQNGREASHYSNGKVSIAILLQSLSNSKIKSTAH